MFWKKTKPRFRILVVCTANVTRSPYVAGLLRKSLDESGLQFSKEYVVESAGVNASPNMPALPTISTIAHTRNIDLNNHLSRILTPELIETSDLILVMEQAHKERILQRRPEVRDRVFLLTEYGRESGDEHSGDVIDPTGKELEDFQEFIAIASDEVKRIVNYIVREGLLD